MCRCSFFRLCQQAGLYRMVALLCVAALVSLLIPNAPLNRRLLQSKSEERQRLLAENEERLLHSQAFIQRLRNTTRSRLEKKVPLPVQPIVQTEGSSLSEGLTINIGVTVIAMTRGREMRKSSALPRTEYLTQSVARLLELMNDTGITRSYRLAICNVDEDPDSLVEAKSLEDLVHVWRRFGSNSNEPGKSIVGKWQKYKMDYVYCLRKTLAQGVQYALIVEDDAIAHTQLFRVLEHVLSQVVESPQSRPLAYIKLYHPQYLLGYISLEVERLIELFSVAASLGLPLALFSVYRTRAKCETTPTHQAKVLGVNHAQGQSALLSASQSLFTWQYRAVLWTWAGRFVMIAVLCLAVGRSNLIELRRLSPQLYQVTPTPSCCTPAMIYTRRGGQRLADFFLNVTCTASKSIDMRMDDFRAELGERGLMIQPSLFHHIGLISSIRNHEVSALLVP